jgi:hypothetical protein
MQNKPKYTITKEYVGQQLKIKYEGIGGGVILFNEINEYRDYGNGKEFYQKYWTKHDCREYIHVGRSYFVYETREAYMRAKRYAFKQQTLR